MIACIWVLIYGIFLTSVNCEFGIPPQHREPLTRLLKRTINHVKSFLGEFEKNIKDSRLIVREIHNQSLLSNNQSILLNQDPKMREEEEGDEDVIIPTIDDEDDLNEDPIEFDYAFINTPAVYKSRNGHLIAAQRRATTIKPLTNLMHPTRFKIDRALYSKQGLLKTAVYRTTLGVKTNNTSMKHPKKLMRQGSTRFQSQELYDSQGNPINPLLFFKGFRIFNNFTKHSKRLIGPAMFQSEEKLYSSRVTLKSNTSTKSINNTKPSKQVTQKVTLTNQTKDKIDANRGIDNKGIVFRGIETAEPTTKRKQNPPHHTLSDFHFRLKEDILSEPTQQYPDIFLRGVDRKSTRTTVHKSSTRYYPQLFTTETVTEHMGGVIPELTKDYVNINFRAQSSDEDDSPKQLLSQNSNSNSKQTFNDESFTKKISCDNIFDKDSSKNITPKNVDTTKDIHEKIANEKLRKIIAPSSYSLSDEETYLKVNLLDQLYHYNKTLNESEVDNR